MPASSSEPDKTDSRETAEEKEITEPNQPNISDKTQDKINMTLKKNLSYVDLAGNNCTWDAERTKDLDFLEESRVDLKQPVSPKILRLGTDAVNIEPEETTDTDLRNITYLVQDNEKIRRLRAGNDNFSAKGQEEMNVRTCVGDATNSIINKSNITNYLKTFQPVLYYPQKLEL